MNNLGKCLMGFGHCKLKMQWIRLSHEAPSHVYFKYNLNEETEWSILDLTRREVRDRPRLTEAVHFPLHEEPVVIWSTPKSWYILDYVPTVFHPFYNALKPSMATTHDEARWDHWWFSRVCWWWWRWRTVKCTSQCNMLWDVQLCQKVRS